MDEVQLTLEVAPVVETLPASPAEVTPEPQQLPDSSAPAPEVVASIVENASSDVAELSSPQVETPSQESPNNSPVIGSESIQAVAVEAPTIEAIAQVAETVQSPEA